MIRRKISRSCPSFENRPIFDFRDLELLQIFLGQILVSRNIELQSVEKRIFEPRTYRRVRTQTLFREAHGRLRGSAGLTHLRLAENPKIESKK